MTNEICQWFDKPIDITEGYAYSKVYKKDLGIKEQIFHVECFKYYNLRKLLIIELIGVFNVCDFNKISAEKLLITYFNYIKHIILDAIVVTKPLIIDGIEEKKEANNLIKLSKKLLKELKKELEN